MERRHLDLAPAGAPTANDGLASLCAEELDLPDDEGFETAGLTVFFAAAVRLETARLTGSTDCGDTCYARGDHVVCDTPNGLGPGEVGHLEVLGGTAAEDLAPLERGDAAAPPRPRTRAALGAARTWREVGFLYKVVRAEARPELFIISFSASDRRSPSATAARDRARLTRCRGAPVIGMATRRATIGGVGPCATALLQHVPSDFTLVASRWLEDPGSRSTRRRWFGICGGFVPALSNRRRLSTGRGSCFSSWRRGHDPGALDASGTSTSCRCR